MGRGDGRAYVAVGSHKNPLARPNAVATAIDRLPTTMRQILSKSLILRGFIYAEFVEQYFTQFLREVGALVADGHVRYREDIVHGLENAPEAFVGMLDRKNFGKAIVRMG